jgi:hypothetical protein
MAAMMNCPRLKEIHLGKSEETSAACEVRRERSGHKLEIRMRRGAGRSETHERDSIGVGVGHRGGESEAEGDDEASEASLGRPLVVKNQVKLIPDLQAGRAMSTHASSSTERVKADSRSTGESQGCSGS